MSPRSLVRASQLDPARWQAGLRDRVVSVRATVGDHAIHLSPEPLFREDRAAGLLQSIRLRVSPSCDIHQLGDAIVREHSGRRLATKVESGPADSFRVLVPAVDKVGPIKLELPGLEPGKEVELELTPQRRWSIHVIHHTHLDIGYTDPQGRVLAGHMAYLDSCLDLVRATETWPDDSRFRWCVEALSVFTRWARHRPAADVDEFVRRVREGSIELTAMPFNVHTELCSTDELHEMLRDARDLRDRWGIQPVVAMQTDIPGAVAGVPDALTEVGVKYLSVAQNWAGRSVPHLVGGQDLPRLFRWRGRSGRDVLVWMTDTPHGLAYMEGQLLGFHESVAAVDDLLPAYLSSLASNPYPYDGDIFGWRSDKTPLHRAPYPWNVLHLRVQGTFGDNAPPRLAVAEAVRAWNEKWAWPRLRMSRNVDFFTAAEEAVGSEIATFEGDWNDWWAEGVGSGARIMALGRLAQSAVADAQTIGAMACHAGDVGNPEHGNSSLDATAVTEAYEAIALFDEHTWGSANPWTDGDAGFDSGEEQWHWKYGAALRAHDSAAELLDSATHQLGARLGRSTAALASFHIVNTAAFDRTGIASCFMPESLVPLDVPIVLRDARNGQALQCRVSPQIHADHRNAGRLVEFRIEVPSVGTVRVDVVPTPDPVVEPQRSTEPAVLENEHLRVQVDFQRACIDSIVEKKTGREIVNRDALMGFGGYVYDRYTTGGGFNHQAHKIESSDKLELLGSRSLARPAALISRTSDAIGEELVFECAAEGLRWLRTTLILYHGIPWLEIHQRLSKPATMGKESAYLAFPFAFEDPEIRVEVTGGVVGTGIPAVPGGAPHMRAMRRWVSMEDKGFAAAWVTRDVPLVQIGQLALPYAPFPPTIEPEPGTIFSWVHNNLWDTNFPSQQAFETDFHYAVAAAATTSTEGGPALAIRTAAAICRPLHGVLGSSAENKAPDQTRLLRIDSPGIRLVSLSEPKPGQLLARLQSFADAPVRARLEAGFKIANAQRATYLGDPAGPLEFVESRLTVDVPAGGIGAVLFDVAP